MAQQTVSIGSSANDGTGDPLRTAFTKINANFTELYGSTAEANDLVEDTTPVLGGDLDTAGKDIVGPSNADIKILPGGTGRVIASALAINGTTLSSDDSSKITIAEALDVTGALTVSGATSLIGNTTIDNLIINDNTISSSSNADINLTPGGTGNVVAGAVTFNGTTLSAADSSKITLAEAVDVTGALTVVGASTLAAVTGTTGSFSSTLGVTGVTTLSGTAVIDNITINDNTISSSSNADINITPGGTGNVVVGAVTFNGTSLSAADSSLIQIAEAFNVSGAVTMASTLGVTGAFTASAAAEVSGTLTTADITTVGTQTITGTLNVDGIQIKDNKITTSTSDAVLEVAAFGTGTVDVQSAMTTIGQTVTGDVDITGSISVDNVDINGNTISATNSNGGITLTPNGTGIITLGGNYVGVTNELSAVDVAVSDEIQMGSAASIVSVATNSDLVLATNGTGTIRINNAQSQSTVGAVGAASKLPLDSANEIRPVGYLKLSLDGTTYAVPYFNAS